MNDPDVSIRLSKHEGPTRGNQQKLYKGRQSQFKMRVVEPWNSIPDQIVGAPSLISFERRLDKFWAGQDIRFNYEAIAVDEIYIIMHMQEICFIPKHAFPPKSTPDWPYSGNMMYPQQNNPFHTIIINHLSLEICLHVSLPISLHITSACK